MNAALVASESVQAPARRSLWRHCLQLWDHLAIYMPLLLMGGLALSTYWLVRNTPVASVPDEPRQVGHEMDYFMRNFTVRTFDELGKLKSEIYGTEGRHFADTDILEIDQVRVRSINVGGLVTTATANRAYSNGDGSEVQLVGNAIVVRNATKNVSGVEVPRMEFRGEFLHAFLNEDRVTSNKPVVLTRGNDQFTGDSFSYNNLDQVANLNGHVHGLIVPRNRVPVKTGG